jgi:hypothetical protein
LEQQVYSIEAANINHETLQAMQQAGQAMKIIHGGMNLEQVDETMYVIALVIDPCYDYIESISSYYRADSLTLKTGTNCANNTKSARRSGRRLPAFRWANSSTRTNWTPSWGNWSRRLWTSVCSILALHQLAPSWTDYRPLEIRSVS